MRLPLILLLAAMPVQATTVYVTTPAGLAAYNSSSGKLTEVKGSPFAVKGIAQAATEGYLVSMEPNWLHSYAIESDGAIKNPEVSSIDLAKYTDADCATNVGMTTDPTGAFIYVSWDGGYDGDGGPGCSSVEAFALSKTGHLTFVGTQQVGNVDINSPAGVVPTSNKFALLNTTGDDQAPNAPGIMPREPGGSFGNGYIAPWDAGIEPGPGFSYYFEIGLEAADSSGHVASLVSECDDEGNCDAVQIASYSVTAQAYTSTNTAENMPYIGTGSPGNPFGAVDCGGPMIVSPNGKVLAIATGTGIQFFHFNGANPPTIFTGIIGESGAITAMEWDSGEHLYAVNEASGRLHIYTATTENVVEEKGSPYAVGAIASEPVVVRL